MFNFSGKRSLISTALLIGLLAAGGVLLAGKKSPLGFTKGLGPLELSSEKLLAWLGSRESGHQSGTFDPASAENCVRCHRKEYKEWSRSMHRASWTSEVFQDGHMAESKQFCINCHAPLKKQTREIAVALKAGRAYGHNKGLAAEGINCVVCHVRNNKILTTGRTVTDKHPLYKLSHLSNSKFCAHCHQFPIMNEVRGRLSIADRPMQNTFVEWEEYRAAGGKEHCQDCHMPRGSHRFYGPHDLEFLRNSIRVKLRKSGPGSYEFRIESVDVGHIFPTGDLFRNLTLEVAPGATEDYETIHRIGRIYELVYDEKKSEWTQWQKSNNGLRPGELRKILVKRSGGFKWRLRYHYASEQAELRSRVPVDRLIRTLHKGRVK